MTESAYARTHSLGDVDPAGSRQRGRRSAVALTDDLLVAGIADGRIVAYERNSGEERWRTVVGDGDGHVVTLVTADDLLLAGTRGPAGRVTALDPATGTARWHHRTAEDVGEQTKDTRFYLPFVVDAVAADDRAYVAARRYERRPTADGNDRHRWVDRHDRHDNCHRRGDRRNNAAQCVGTDRHPNCQ